MPYLIVERASVIVERRKLDKDEITIGRAPTNDIVLDDPEIGGQLAAIKLEAGGYKLIDQGSMGGVTFANERISTLPLKNGMRFEAFPFSFVYEDDGSMPEPEGDSRLEATQAMDMSIPGEGA